MSALADARRSPFEALDVMEARALVAQALAAPGAERPVVVDFDETLWLRNSTEEYLRSLRPRLLAYLILQIIDVVRPWAFLRDRNAIGRTRDWIRVVACTLLMPWGLVSWRIGAAERARCWRNEVLIGWLTDPRRQTPILVATLGFEILVRPLLRHIDPRAELVAAASFWTGWRIRKVGKAAWIDRVKPGIVADAVVITDSENDADLLAGAAVPILLKWPNAAYRPAFGDSYVPFLYTQRAKRPGENYMLYGFLLEDVVHLWLAFAWTTMQPILGMLAILLMHMGFFAVYELGYHENDVLAVRHEDRPTLKPEAAAYIDRVDPATAWMAGLAMSLPGLALLWWSSPASLTTSSLGLPPAASLMAATGVWLAYLTFQWASFRLYNRLDTQTRGLFYVLLQIVRLSGYAVLLRVNAVGAAILLSLVLARWVKYIAYRDTGRTWKESQRLLMLAFFLLIAVTLLPADPGAFFTLQAAAAFAWLAVYAHQRVRAIGRAVRLYRY